MKNQNEGKAVQDVEEPGQDAGAGDAVLTEAEAEAIFDEASGLNPDPVKDDDAPAEEKNAEAETQIPAEKPAEPAAAAQAASQASDPAPESLKKALADTQAWATKLAQELAGMKAKPATTQAKPAEVPKPAVEEVPKEIQDFYADYPEFKNAVEYEARKLIQQTLGDFDPSAVKNIASTVQGDLAQMNFNTQVLNGVVTPAGQYVEGHPDAFKLFAMPEYSTFWAEEVRKNPSLGATSDPVEAIGVLTRFKTFKAAQAAAAHDQTAAITAQEMKDFASGTVASGNAAHKTAKTEKSPEEIFDQFAT